MSEILTHSRANDARLRFKPRDTKMQAMNLQTNKSPNGQTDMVALRGFQSTLSPFDTRKLFEPPMVDLDLPGIQSIEGSFFNGHIQPAGRPVFCVAVCADRPEHLHPAIALEMHQTSLDRNKDLSNGAVATAVDADFPVALELGEPVPLQATQQFEIGQSAVPTVKDGQFGPKTPFGRLLNHVLKMIVLGQAILRLVIQAKIAGQPTFTICPHHRDQVDPLNHPSVLTRPMPLH